MIMTEMSEMNEKCSFVCYYDWLELFQALPNDRDRVGLLYTIFNYAQYGVICDNLSDSARIAFVGIRQQLERDRLKWEDTCTKRSEAGKRGGRPKAKKPNAFSKKQKEAKKAEYENEDVHEYVNVNDTDDDNIAKSVGLSVEEYQSLLSLCSEQQLKGYISGMNAWKVKSGKGYRNPFETIKGWIEKDKQKTASGSPSYDLDAFDEFAKNYDLEI